MSIFDSSINPRCIIPAGSRWRIQCPPSTRTCIPAVLKTTSPLYRERVYMVVSGAQATRSLLPLDIVSRISGSGKMHLTLMRLHFSNGRRHTHARAHSLSLSLSFSLFTFLRLLRFFHRPCRLRTTHVWNATRSGKKLPMHPVYRCFLSFAEKFPPFLSFFHSCATYMLVERVKAITCYTITFA